MADPHVAAHSAAFNSICAVSPTKSAPAIAAPRRLADQFSLLLTTLCVAIAQQRRFETAAYDRLHKCHADAAWATVASQTTRLIKAAGADAEDRAFVALALVINRLAELRGTRAGIEFHCGLMADPIELIGLFRHARSHRSDMLMSVAFKAIDTFGSLRAFGASTRHSELGTVAA